MASKIKLKEENLVVIEMPKIVVPEHLAEHYLKFINKVCSDLTNYQVTDFCDDDVVYKIENVYGNGKLYPVACKRTNFEDILNIYRPNVTQYDKFVELESDSYYSYKDEIVKLYEQILEPDVQEEQENE